MPDRPVRILAVDDSAEILSVLARGLGRRGYEVHTAEDGRSARRALARTAPDLVLLDLMLPDVDGVALCEDIRQRVDVPIIMLTARDTVSDRVEGLLAGADDYVVKPFAIEELAARIEAVLRRRPPHGSALVYEDLRIDREGHRVARDGIEIHLTPSEFELLVALAQRPGRVVTREQLVASLWPDAEYVDDSLVDSHITNLRKKVEVGQRRRLIQTVRGIGFVLR